MDIEKIFIVGSGLMGSGIAQVCAQSGIDVVLYDIEPEALKKALKNIEWSVGKFVEKGELKEEKSVVMGRIKTVTDFSDAGTSDLIIEAVFENLALHSLKPSWPATPLLSPSLKLQLPPRGPRRFSVFTFSVPYP